MTAQQEGGRYPIDAVPSGLSTWSARVQALPAIIAAVTAVIVALLTSVLAIKREQRQRTAAEQQERIRLYFSPLRIAVAENLYRLTELHSVAAKNGSVPALCAVAKPSELEQKDLTWFNGTGAYLASSSYYAACVFASINRVRSELPYLRLKQEQDTLLLTQLRKVSLGYLRNLGVFFATQDSIGEMLIHDNKVMSYKNYCELLRDAETLAWLDRLVQYYLDIGNGQNLERVCKAISAMTELLEFLDQSVGGGSSIDAIRDAEARPSLI